ALIVGGQLGLVRVVLAQCRDAGFAAAAFGTEGHRIPPGMPKSTGQEWFPPRTAPASHDECPGGRVVSGVPAAPLGGSMTSALGGGSSAECPRFRVPGSVPPLARLLPES